MLQEVSIGALNEVVDPTVYGYTAYYTADGETYYTASGSKNWDLAEDLPSEVTMQVTGEMTDTSGDGNTTSFTCVV